MITGVLTLASVITSSLFLGFRSDRNDLVAQDLPWNKRFVDWQRSFAGTRDLAVVIDTHSNGRALTPEAHTQARELADELGARLNSGPHVDPSQGGAIWRFDRQSASPRTVRLLPMPEFREQMAKLAASGPVIQSVGPAELLTRISAEMEHSEGGADGEKQALHDIEELRSTVRAFGHVLTSPDGGPALAELIEHPDGPWDRWIYQTSVNGRFYFIRIAPRYDHTQLNALAPAIAGVRKEMAAVAPKYPALEVGLTGIEVVEADETETATNDAAVASAVSFVLILILLVLAYRSFKTPILAMIALSVGLAWTFGFTTIAIGHLQVLSVTFSAMLLGISDAYGVHIGAHYELIRRNYPDDVEGCITAMRKSFENMGPGIITGALSTAGAFLTMMFTNFLGAAEMGLISGVGIVLCMGAMFTVYPAMIRLTKWRYKHVPTASGSWVQFYSDRWIGPFSRWPRITLAVAALLTLIAAGAVTQMRFDHDLMKLQAIDAPGVQWARRVVEGSGRSIYSGVSVCKNIDEARERARLFRALPDVDSVNGVGVLFPEDEPAKLGIIHATRASLGLGEVSTMMPAFTPTTGPANDIMAAMLVLRLKLRVAATREMPEEIRAALDRLAKDIDAVSDAASRGTGDERAARTARLWHAYREWRQAILAALDEGPLEVGDLPAEVMRPYKAIAPGDARVVLEVHPRLPDAKTTGIDSALHPLFLPGFMRHLRSVDPGVTGVIAQVDESGTVLLRAYIGSGIAATVIIFVMLWFDFRSITFALISLAPVAIGFIVTIGIMWFIGLSVNAANIIVLPLMFGIGVDSGVHILHRYRLDPVTRPLGLTHSTGKAITITALTTIVGFAAMMPAHHRGIASLGFVLTIGLSCTLLACMTVMPAWLELIRPRTEGGAREQ